VGVPDNAFDRVHVEWFVHHIVGTAFPARGTGARRHVNEPIATEYSTPKQENFSGGSLLIFVARRDFM